MEFSNIKFSNVKDKEVDDMLSKLRKRLPLQEIILGGSYAKGTYIDKDFDVDIFVRFNESENISDKLEDAIKDLKPQRVHGSRDYFKIGKFEIVPVKKISDPKDAENVTDMSPLHVKWVKENIGNKQRDIRLAKLFCKANDVYGAESYIQGLSGHVLDILVIYYGSFQKLLEAATKWKKKEVIDFYNYYKGKALQKLNKSKIVSPLIVIDPLQPDRNAAAALGEEKFNLFKKKAKEFLENPSEEFFKKKPMTQERLSKIKGKHKLLIFYIEPLPGKKDIVGSKLKKAFTYIKNKIEHHSFEIISSGWEWEKEAMFYFICKYEMLEKEFTRIGPPLTHKYHVNLFKKKHNSPFKEDGRIKAKVQRKYRKVEQLAMDLLQNEIVKKQVKTIELRFER